MLNPAFDDFKGLLATLEPPELGPEPREGTLPENELISKLRLKFVKASIAEHRRPVITALTLLWHDHLDAAHNVAQDIENADGSFLHGIMHRREPDYGNAKYWFRRTGLHAAFPEIAQRVRALPSPNQTSLFASLKGGNWDPYAFVDACQAALNSRDVNFIEYLRKIQQIESDVLLEQFLS